MWSVGEVHGGELHALTEMKSPPVPLQQEAGWAPELVGWAPELVGWIPEFI